MINTQDLATGSLNGVAVLLDGDITADTTREAARRLVAAGANVGAVVTAGLTVSGVDIRDVQFLVVRPGQAAGPPIGGPQQLIFDTRSTITAARAARSNLLVVLDGDAFIAAAVDVISIAPYADAVIGDRGQWRRVPPQATPTADELVAASLTPGAERLLLPVRLPDWHAVQAFMSRGAALVEVGGTRPLTVAEIVARHQAEQRRQDALVSTAIGIGTTTLLFEVPGFVAPVTITAETTMFRGGGVTTIEERDIRVNGAAIAGGGAKSPPELPLIEAERIGTPPLAITLDDAYTYVLDDIESVGGSRCYVVRFEPRVPARGLAHGRAWIGTADFAVRRLETRQTDLHGAIVSSEQIDEFGATSVGNAVVWLPIETRIFQAYEGAGFRTPIHRTIAVTAYEINSPGFDARLQAALASDHVMLRETAEGLRYLVRSAGSAERVVQAHAGHSIRSIIAGALIDPNITEPLFFAGLSYVNLNLFDRGGQINAFFGGVFGQAAWSAPSIAGTRWQAHGAAIGIASHYSDRVFRGGREQYSEHLVQRPAQASIGVLRPLTARVHATIDYEFTFISLARSVATAPAFRAPANVVSHAAVVAMDAERGGWGLRGWWSPARRQGWRAWGLPGQYRPETTDYQRYGARITRTVALRASVASRVQVAWVGGHDLDRFSQFGVDAFDNPLHGYGTASIRYDKGALLRSATTFSRRGWRVDAFADLAVVHDPGWGSAMRTYSGVGAGLESGGPFRTLWSVEWGYGFQARRQDGGRGTQAVRITMYRGF